MNGPNQYGQRLFTPITTKQSRQCVIIEPHECYVGPHIVVSVTARHIGPEALNRNARLLEQALCMYEMIDLLCSDDSLSSANAERWLALKRYILTGDDGDADTYNTQEAPDEQSSRNTSQRSMTPTYDGFIAKLDSIESAVSSRIHALRKELEQLSACST